MIGSITITTSYEVKHERDRREISDRAWDVGISYYLHDKIQYICANFSDKVHFTRGKVGTVSQGEAEMKNLSIGELLRKQAKF